MKDPLFWKWLQNRNCNDTVKEVQPRLEISLPDRPAVKSEITEKNRGVAIIQLY